MQKISGLDLLINLVNNLPLDKEEEIIVEDLYAGGVVSIVGKGIYKTGTQEIPVAIKYTKEKIEINDKFAPTEAKDFLKKAAATQAVDAQVLQKLQNHKSIKVPTVLKYFKEQRVTIMKDFNTDGFQLLQTSIIEGNVPSEKSFKEIGQVLADLRIEMAKMKDIKQVEDPVLQMEQRTEELRVSLYDGRMDFYNALWKNLLNPETSTFSWTDGHPKNMAINSDGEIMVFDFGRSIACDSEYPVANYLGQIFLFSIAGTIDVDTLFALAKALFTEYETTYQSRTNTKDQLNEKNLVWYITAEFAHRGKTMRWIDPKIIKVEGETDKISQERVKAAVDHIIDLVFDKDDPITSMQEFEGKFRQIYKHLHESKDSYRRPSIK